jgi:hypothetical protein
VQFQLVSRQPLDEEAYTAAWEALNGVPPLTEPTKVLPYASYLRDSAAAATPIEETWKDTVIVYPGTVTTIRVRFAPVDGSPGYGFDPTAGPGYV